MANNPTNNISPLLSGALFNGESVYVLAAASLTVESNLIAISRIIAPSTASLSIESDLVVNATLIGPPSGSASLTIESDLTANGTVLPPPSSSASLTIESGLSAVATAIFLPALSLSVESNLTSVARLIALGRSSLDSNLNVNAVAKIIIKATATLDGLLNISINDLSIVGPIQPVFLSSSLNLLISDLIRFTPSTRTPGSLVPLVLLDGIPLTGQNRKFNNSNKPVFVEKQNWNSSKSRYYKRSDSGKQSFKLSWEWLPSDREYTIDKRQARNFIKDKAMDPDVHTLTIIEYGQNPGDIFQETQYNVFITNYTEDLIRRDLTTGTYFWKCDVDLEEL